MDAYLCLFHLERPDLKGRGNMARYTFYYPDKILKISERCKPLSLQYATGDLNPEPTD